MNSRIAEQDRPKLVDGEVACHYMGIKRSKLWQLILSGELKSIKVGRRRLIPMSAIDDFIASKLAE